MYIIFVYLYISCVGFQGKEMRFFVSLSADDVVSLDSYTVWEIQQVLSESTVNASFITLLDDARANLVRLYPGACVRRL